MDFSWCLVHHILVFARFCKNVIKTSSRSYTGANYQKCVSCGTFIDFQHVWKELFFFVLLDRLSYIWSPVIQQNSFFNSPLLTSPPYPNPVTWRQLCMWRKLTWTLTSPPHPTPTQWRDVSCACINFKSTLHPISKNDKNAGVVNGAVGKNKLAGERR